MVVVADTGPLRYLVEIGIVDVLAELYGSVLTTTAVIQELKLPHFPADVREWAEQTPAWLKIDSPLSVEFLDRLDSGEASALSLAIERAADLVLIDERDGTAIARGLGLVTYGTLGVIALAGARGLLDFAKNLEALATTTQFRLTAAVIERARLRYRELCDSRPH